MKCNTCGKMDCLAHGDDVEKGINQPVYGRGHLKGGMSDAGLDTRIARDLGEHPAAKESVSSAKEHHKKVLGESRAMPKPKLKGLAKGGVAGKDGTDMYAMKPDVPAMHGMDEGGEMDEDSGVDDELNDMVADECFEAFEKKDKKAFVEAMKALIMNVGGK